MKRKWMYLALFTWFYLLAPTYITKLVVMGLALVFLLYRKEQLTIVLFLLLVILFTFIQSYRPKLPADKIEGRVIEVRKKHFIVEDGFNKYWIQSEHDIDYDDVLSVSCNFSSITSTSNRVGFEFDNWAKNNRIFFQCSNPKIETIKTGNSFRHYIFQKTKSFPNYSNKVVDMFLFRNHDYESSYLTLLLSSGIHISFLLSMFMKLLNYFFVEKQVKPVIILFGVFLCLFYNFSFFMLRTITRLITRFYVQDKRDGWGLYALVLMLIYAGNVHNSVCMFSICLSLVSSFSYEKQSFSTMSIMAVLQLL